MASVNDYLKLIVNEHADQPLYGSTIALSVQPFVDSQNVSATFPVLYDLDVSLGVQEDADGLWIGVSRYVPVPLTNVYFSWGVLGLGWGQGAWKGQFDPDVGLVRLDDETYRLLLKARVIANSWNGTTAGAMPALQELFNNTTTPNVKLFIQDHMDMSMSFVVAGQWPSAIFLALLATGELGIKPTGVRVNYVKTSVDGAPVFGWGVQNSFVAGWGTGAWAVDIATYTGKNLFNDGGVLMVTPDGGYPPFNSVPGGLYSNGGVVSVTLPTTPNPLAPPIFFNTVTSSFLLAVGGEDLPIISPAVGSGQLWNNGGEVCVA